MFELPSSPTVSAAEQALQLLHHAYAAVLMWDLDGSITFCNRGAEQIYGRRAADVVGQHRAELGDTTFPDGFDAVQATEQVKIAVETSVQEPFLLEIPEDDGAFDQRGLLRGAGSRGHGPSHTRRRV